MDNFWTRLVKLKHARKESPQLLVYILIDSSQILIHTIPLPMNYPRDGVQTIRVRKGLGLLRPEKANHNRSFSLAKSALENCKLAPPTGSPLNLTQVC